MLPDPRESAASSQDVTAALREAALKDLPVCGSRRRIGAANTNGHPNAAAALGTPALGVAKRIAGISGGQSWPTAP